MNFAQKSTLIWLMTAVLVLLALVCSRAEDEVEVEVPINFCVEDTSGTERIALYDEGEGEYILFLPSYAELGQVILATAPEGGVMIGSEVLSEGADCGGLELDQKYPLSLAGKESGTIRFLRSANVATMFIDTATGNMLRIHGDKNYRESAAVRLYTADGELDYTSQTASMKGRGNSTWNYEKKPYALILSEDGDLLHMGAAKNWVLLANASDITNLRNKLVLDLARKFGFEWVPDSEYVDIYLNGAYSGLYQLTEKVEIGVNRLNIDPEKGAFLCKIDLKGRWNGLRNPFETSGGRTVELTAPEVQSDDSRKRSIALVEQMEQEIQSGENLSNSELLDLDSWVYRYLIDEVAANIDADKVSSYFYWSNGKMYAGPIWDYDLGFGNWEPTSSPQAFLAKMRKKEAVTSSEYYFALYQNRSFYARMIEIYREHVSPALEQIIHTEIDDLAAQIEVAARNNDLRWSTMYQRIGKSGTSAQAAEQLAEYIKERKAFLDSAWIEGVEYCTLQFEHTEGNYFENITVKKGAVFASDSIDTSDTVWFEMDSGAVYDFSQPVTEDVILVKQSIAQPHPHPPATRDYVTIASIIGLVFLLLSFGAVDLIRRNKERRRTNAGEKVSS